MDLHQAAYLIDDTYLYDTTIPRDEQEYEQERVSVGGCERMRRCTRDEGSKQ